MDLDTPIFTLAEAAIGADLPRATAEKWIQREHFLLGARDRAASGRGVASLFTLRRVIQLAIAAKLSIWLEPEKAAQAALLFTDYAGGREGRQPGELHRGPNVLTWLIVSADGAASVHRISADASAIGLLARGSPIIVLDIARVLNEVRARLDLRPDDPRVPQGETPRYADQRDFGESQPVAPDAAPTRHRRKVKK